MHILLINIKVTTLVKNLAKALTIWNFNGLLILFKKTY